MAACVSDLRCELGEGPAYEAAADTAWWFDILGRKLVEHRFGPGGGTRVHELPWMASQLSFVDEHTHLIAAEDGLHLRDRASGSLTPYLPLEAEMPGTRSNDGRVHPCGALWIGTMGKRAEQRAGAIYHVLAGRVTRLWAGISIPNAICFSPDGRTGYFADTSEGRLMRVALDPATGLPAAEPELLAEQGGEGGPDGAVTDSEGRIWNARWGAGRLDCYAPDGALLRSVPVPARQVSCPCFVGPRLDRMLVTSAFEGMDAAARAADPGHGRAFLLDVGARGLPEPRVRIA